MAVAPDVYSDGSQSATLTTEHTLDTITAPNVYELNVDLANMVGGATPDIVVIKEYIKVRSGGTERLLHSYTFVGAQEAKAFKTNARMSPHHIKYTLTQTQGASGRSFDWAIYQAQQ